jgi:alkylation response protein AidB-like acyl-CoA dehydrogenase
VALRLADMATRIEAVRALLGRAALAVDDNAADADALCNMVKVLASEELFKVAQHAMELHGGNGVMLDFGVEKIFRDAAIFLHMDATAGKYAGAEANHHGLNFNQSTKLRRRQTGRQSHRRTLLR